MRLALYQPEIPQNTGTLMRTAACLEVGLDIIEPCGFVFSDKHLKRAGMDYLDLVQIERHNDWAAFNALYQTKQKARIVLVTTKASVRYADFSFQPDDVLLMGSEGAGVPQNVHDDVDAQITIPMAENARSLNIAVSAAMVLSEALRQTQSFP